MLRWHGCVGKLDTIWKQSLVASDLGRHNEGNFMIGFELHVHTEEKVGKKSK